ncbi:MAG TPA: pyruvate dehydrogenase (acetyl-transferring) E1 component subunit alpha [Planctomycetota bacterium]|nr:pyruvate dehydrogenase (acetyl-transferring) E1 component subunit alpha [Planctomycetota bacterium]
MQAAEMVSELSVEQLTHFYRQMVLIRLFEEKTNEMYHKGRVSGYCHLYIGEEAVAVGALNALRPDDYVIGAYRDHGHAIVKGCDPKHVMAELFGKATGVSRGKGGSMHMFNRDLRFFGGDGIVAGELPIAVGLAFAIEYQKGDQIVLCFFGDGAVNEGGFHEAMNWAALWNLPVIFLCENNLWGMGTPVAKASCAIELTERACCYCMRLDRVDGMDVLAVHDVVGRTVKYCRDTRKPTFIEATTQRFAGHSVTDAQVYRSKEEIAKVREHDPISRLRRVLVEQGIKQPAELDEIDTEAASTVDEAVRFAESSPFPEPQELRTDLWDGAEKDWR